MREGGVGVGENGRTQRDHGVFRFLHFFVDADIMESLPPLCINFYFFRRNDS